MAAQISSGEAEAAGSRILDDIDLVYLSGSRKNLVCTLDFGEYDSHCTYVNFREPIIRGLKECFELDGSSLFCRRTRVEMVDNAYGVGRIHGTLWDIGRRVFRGNFSKYIELKETDEWKRNYGKFNGKLIAPSGVKLIFVPMDMIHDVNGDSLFCSGIGEDCTVLLSHGSGELTALLANSLMNAAMSDVSNEEEFMNSYLTLRYRRCVGDDRLEIYRVKQRVSGKVFDRLKSRMGEIVNNCGHVVNPVKLFFGYGSAEYRQSHCLRGALIPKDQIMVLSSEKSKFVDNVQSFLLGYRGHHL